MNIRIAIVEDHAQMREGLSAIIRMTPGFLLVANCANGKAALEDLPNARPDVTIMDINMPQLNGIECVRELRQKKCSGQFLMLTIEENTDRVFAALEAGAHGYLIKNMPADRIIEAIRELHSGGSPISPQIARKLVHTFHKPGAAAAVVDSPEHHLTEREQQVLTRFSQGDRAKDVADQLGISVYTVQTHVRNIYDKLHVRSLAEAVAKARVG
jgi:DNA-binding NarL/FixJ family response regulator